MFNTIEEIKKNIYINNLDDICTQFGLCGCYAKFTNNANPQKNGIYFIMGTDASTVENPDTDVLNIIKMQEKEKNYFHLNVAAIKLTDCSPFMAHQDVARYCRDVELVRGLHKKYGKNIPSKIDSTVLFYMRALYVNTLNNDLSAKSLGFYQDALAEYFKISDAKINPNNPEYEKEQMKRKGYTYGTKLDQFKRKIKGQSCNNVSLEQLFKMSDNITKRTISAKYLEPLKNELNNHPDILYWASEPEEITFKVPEGGMGLTKDANDLSTAQIAYDSIYSEDISSIMLEILYPEATHLDANYNKEKENGICHMGINEIDFNKFYKICKLQKIPFAIDLEDVYFNNNKSAIHTMFYQKDAEKVNSILVEMARSTEKTHFLEKQYQDPVVKFSNKALESDIDDDFDFTDDENVVSVNNNFYAKQNYSQER